MASRRIQAAPVARTSQPQGLVRVDQSNALSANIEFLYVGGSLVDAAKGRIGSIIGTPGNRVGASGLTLAYDGSSRAIQFPRDARLEPASGFTAWMYIYVPAYTPASTNDDIFCKTYGNNGSAPYISWSIGNASSDGGGTSTNFKLAFAINGSLVTTQMTCPVGMHIVGVTYDGSNIVGYVDNAQATSLGAPGSVTYDTTSSGNLILGGSSGASVNKDFRGDIYAAGFHSRVFSLRDFQVLSANPWQLFTPIQREIFTNSPLYPSKRIVVQSPTRTTQPQGLARINPAFVGLGLNYVFLPSASTFIEVAKSAAISAASGLAPTVTVAGRAISNGGSGYVSVQGLNQSQVFSRIAVITPNTTGANATISDSTNGVSGTNSGAQWHITNSEITIDKRNNNNLLNSTGAGIAAGKTSIVGVTYDGAVARLYADGRLVGERAVVDTFALGGTGLLMNDGNGLQFPFDGAMALHVDFFQALSVDLMKSLTANPWQVFK